MNKKWISVLLIIIVFLIIFGVVKFVVDLNKEKEMTEEVVSIINSSYQELQSNVIEYNKYRSLVGDSLSSYYQDSFGDEYDKIVSEFEGYDKVVSNISNNIDVIKNNCGDKIFADSDVNDICNSYKSSYEEIVNVYVNDINNFNKFVNTYNSETGNDLSNFKSSVIDNYIDYNNDGEYRGMEDNEES